MIKRIFQDLDECILHTRVNSPVDQDHVEFVLGEDMHAYRSIIRPCAKELFAYYNDLVGKENVYILTTACLDYAEALNQLGEFGLDTDHIFAREHMQKHSYNTRMHGNPSILPHVLADRNNVLIDNLPCRHNETKMDFMKITINNYHQTKEYYGVNFPDDPFFEKIQKFLKERIETPLAFDPDITEEQHAQDSRDFINRETFRLSQLQ